MRAPWAYPDEPSDEDDTLVSAPTWDCPGGSCYCHTKPLVGEHRLFLFDRMGHRMPGARCRVLVGRRELNQRMPFADGRGSVLFPVHGAVGDVTVEWAPAEMPREPEYPYRVRYAAPNLTDHDDDREHVRRRLANLGFSRFSKLNDNVGDFQQALGRPLTRRWHAAQRSRSRQYHDRTWWPRFAMRCAAACPRCRPMGRACSAAAWPTSDLSPRRASSSTSTA